MPFSLDLDPQRELVKVRHRGVVTVAEFNESRPLVAQACREHGWTRVLVDCLEITSGLSLIELFEAGDSNREHGLTSSMALALVLPDQLWEDGGVYQTVSRKHALEVQLFRTEEEALAWLESVDDNGSNSAA